MHKIAILGSVFTKFFEMARSTCEYTSNCIGSIRQSDRGCNLCAFLHFMSLFGFPVTFSHFWVLLCTFEYISAFWVFCVQKCEKCRIEYLDWEKYDSCLYFLRVSTVHTHSLTIISKCELYNSRKEIENRVAIFLFIYAESILWECFWSSFWEINRTLSIPQNVEIVREYVLISNWNSVESKYFNIFNNSQLFENFCVVSTFPVDSCIFQLFQIFLTEMYFCAFLWNGFHPMVFPLVKPIVFYIYFNIPCWSLINLMKFKVFHESIVIYVF